MPSGVAVPELVNGEDDVAAPRQFERTEGGGRFFVALVAVQGKQRRCGLGGGRGFRAVEFADHWLQFFGHEGDGADVKAAEVAFDAVTYPSEQQGKQGEDAAQAIGVNMGECHVFDDADVGVAVHAEQDLVGFHAVFGVGRRGKRDEVKADGFEVRRVVKQVLRAINAKSAAARGIFLWFTLA